jgi:hypothetical protein
MGGVNPTSWIFVISPTIQHVIIHEQEIFQLKTNPHGKSKKFIL